VTQVVNQQVTNQETTLRHFFYLEYKKNFAEGEKNPIVYSKFGKQHYFSDEKFDPNNFNQLVRTCNLKKILRLHDNNKDRKLTDPIHFPFCNYYKPINDQDKTLVFESRFEFGNLQLVHK